MEVYMRNIIATTLTLLGTTLGFAQETPIETLPTLVQLDLPPALPKVEEKPLIKSSFGYLKMGVSDSETVPSEKDIIPGIGIGYRIFSGSSALDISASISSRTTRENEEKLSSTSYVFPRVNYLYYPSAKSSNSFYAGGGLSWGAVYSSSTSDLSKNSNEFVGLIPNINVGYEMSRMSTIRTFIQLDVSQPVIAATRKGDLPRPFAEISLGAGF